MPDINRYFWLFFTCFHLITGNSYSQEITPNKTVLLAILARNKAHILPAYLDCIDKLDYDKKLITVYIDTNNNQDNTQAILEEWANSHKNLYHNLIFNNHVEKLTETRPHEWTAERFKVLATIRNHSMQKTKEQACDFYFVVDCDNLITPPTLKTLVNKACPIIAPMLLAVPEKNDAYSNYFCAISENGYYANHPEYFEILSRQKVGTFQVPVVHCTYLIDAKEIDKLNYLDDTNDYEFVIFSRIARKNGVDQYICNEQNFGVLLHFFDDLSLDQEVKRTQEYLKTHFF